MFREIILPIFKSTRLCVTACGVMNPPRCCRPKAGNIVGGVWPTVYILNKVLIIINGLCFALFVGYKKIKEIKISIAKCNVQNLAGSVRCRISDNSQKTCWPTQLFRLVWDNRWMWWNAHIIRCRAAMHREIAHTGRAVLTEFCNLRCIFTLLDNRR